MSIFKKPLFAFILCLILVVSSTVISVHARLDPRCEAITDHFHSSGGIADQLDAVCDASLGILQIAENYGLETDDVRSITDTLRFSITNESAMGVYDLYRFQSSEIKNLCAVLKQTVSGQDKASLETLCGALDAAQEAIRTSDYNEIVNSFLRKDLGVFSVFFARLCGVRLPDRFA